MNNPTNILLDRLERLDLIMKDLKSRYSKDDQLNDVLDKEIIMIEECRNATEYVRTIISITKGHLGKV